MLHRRIPCFAAALFVAFCGISRAQQTCSARTLVGTYQLSYEGVLVVEQPENGPPISVAAVLLGLATIDYGGNLTGSATGSNGGQIMDVEFSGTISVTPDCTGTARWRLKPKGSPVFLPTEAVEKFVIRDGGETVTAIVIQGVLGRPVSLGTWKRMSRVPTPVDF